MLSVIILIVERFIFYCYAAIMTVILQSISYCRAQERNDKCHFDECYYDAYYSKTSYLVQIKFITEDYNQKTQMNNNS